MDWEDISHSITESRFKRIGTSISNRVLLVVYTIRRMEYRKETIRIISARKASRKERQAYAGL
ncbi:MAG: BrnT family toxin [Deltaproteobacteria bacterium]|nr:BrnT family toxin [Deltaproteobacteria bacterium]